MNVQINSPFETTNLFWEVLLHVLLVILLLLLVKHLSTDRAVQHLIVMLNFDVGNLGEGSKQVTWVIVYPPQLLQCKWHSKQVTKEQNVYLSQMLLQITKRKKQNQNNNSKNKKVYLSQMLLYMDLKVLASSREGGVAPWAVHLFRFISLFLEDSRSIHWTPSSCFDISF